MSFCSHIAKDNPKPHVIVVEIDPEAEEESVNTKTIFLEVISKGDWN